MRKRSNKQKIRSLICIFSAILAAILLGFNGRYLQQNPFSTNYVFDAPSYVATSDYGYTLVTDKSKEHISVLDEQQKVCTSITGKRNDKQGFFISDFTATDGTYIYTTDIRYIENGSRVREERIVRYLMNGAFDKVVYECNYGDKNGPLQYGNIVSMKEYKGTVYFILRTENELSLFGLKDGKAKMLRTVQPDSKEPGYKYTYDAHSDKIIYVSRNNAVFAEQVGGTFAKTAEMTDASGIILGETAVDGKGVLYCMDMGHGEIIRLPDRKNCLSVGICYRISVNTSGEFGVTDNESIIIADENHQIFNSNQAPYSSHARIGAITSWLCVVYFSLCIIYYFILLCIRTFFHLKKSQVSKNMFGIIVSILITSTLVAAMLYTKTDKRGIDERLNHIKELATAVSALSKGPLGDGLDSIEGTKDYGSDAFEQVRSQLDVYCNASYANKTNLYYILYKFDTKSDLLYGVMDYEDTINAKYPYMNYIGSPYEEAVVEKKVITVGNDADAYGYWTFSIAPIYNSRGTVCGIVEFGTNLLSEQENNTALIKDIVISTIVFAFLMLLILTEIFTFNQSNHELTSTRIREDKMLCYLRPVAFLLFCANSFDSAFVPQMAEKLMHTSAAFIPKFIGAALPLSMQPLFIAAAAIGSGILINKKGLKKVILAGIGISIIGILTGAFSNIAASYLFLLTSKALSGLGMGAVMIGLSAMPGYNSNNERRNKAFTDINMGIVSGVVVGGTLGAYVAGYAGYAATFFAAALLLSPTAILIYKSVENGIGIADRSLKTERKSHVHEQKGYSQIIAFFVTVMFPFLVIMCFKEYIFPVFAAANGQSEIYIGNILLIAGAVSIFLGPTLSGYMLNNLGSKKALMAASSLLIISTMIFGFYPNNYTMVFAVLAVSIGSCVGLVCQEIYYVSLKEVELFGYSKSMSAYNLVDNLSQMAGPLILGLLLATGYKTASLAIAFMAAGLLLLFIIINKFSKKRLRKEHQ